MSSQLEKLLNEARTRLIDSGTRNRLVHTNRNGKRPFTLAIVYPDADQLFSRLVTNSASMRFLADPIATARERRRAEPDDASDDDAHTDNNRGIFLKTQPQGTAGKLQTSIGQSALDKRLTKMLLEAKTLEQEQGINVFYLAIGFLRWYEDENSQVLREAPLILVPVQITRNVVQSHFDLSAREDDRGANIALAERLREFGINLPEITETDEEWIPSGYFDQVRDAISNQPRWSIDTAGVELGFFSFAKLLMFTQLTGKNWPGQSILSHPLLRGLLQDGFAREAPLFRDDENIDAIFQPAHLMHVLDADGSQTLAIETVRKNKNLVIQGPPGTGKSQTIANIIAAAVHDGKSVLFVAEKMVALEVVYTRLERVGLKSACLELHSRNANKRAVLQELKRTLESGLATLTHDGQAARLTQARDTLNAHAARMHAPIGKCGVTPFQALGRLSRSRGAGYAASRINVPSVQDWSPAKIERAQKTIARLAACIETSGPPRANPWFGVARADLQPMDLARLDQTIAELTILLSTLSAESTALLPVLLPGEAASLDTLRRVTAIMKDMESAPASVATFKKYLDPLAPRYLKSLSDTCALGARLQLEKSKETPRYRPVAFLGDHRPVRSALIRGTVSIFARWGSSYRAASAELASWIDGALPKKATERLSLIDKLIAIKQLEQDFDRQSTEVTGLLGGCWRGVDTEFALLGRACEWFLAMRNGGHLNPISPALEIIQNSIGSPSYSQKKLVEILAAASGMTNAIVHELKVDCQTVLGHTDINAAPLTTLIAKITRWRGALGNYADWGALARADADVRELDLTALADAAGASTIPHERLVAEFELASAEAIWRCAIGTDRELATAVGGRIGAATETFRDAERKRRGDVAHMIAANHLAQIPTGALGEMAIIRGEIARQRGHMPIRRLIEKAGRSVQKIKPVFLMSPLSVAQFLPPGLIEFDLLVIDEASQVRPEDALGVIARSRQIVVVGDAKQLPPTNFFGRLMDDATPVELDDDELEINPDEGLRGAARVADMESILTFCTARGLNGKMLRWHYRSRHPSLIAVSNAEFYDNRLYMPPSPSMERTSEGFMRERVQGSYERGGKRINTIEARAIVAALAAHVQSTPDHSIGIVTFSVSQRDEILRLIDEERRTDPVLDRFLTNQDEEVFVKNLENVQGDERDTILISVGYGPRAPGGRLDAMNFGPVSVDGGERRLNVLFTRARFLCRVFVSFDSGDIDLGRATGAGPRVLKRFLAFAETGQLEQAMPTGEDSDSPFEDDVATAIKSIGYLVDNQVGSAGFKIDLGVRDPNQPGRYILAVECDGATYHSAMWARERDRMRQELLEGLGWQFHRIWSTDWFHRREAEIDRLKAALLNAANATPAKPPAAPSRPEPLRPAQAPRTSQAVSNPYRLAKVPVPMNIAPHEVDLKTMARIVSGVVDTEGPVHSEEIARRVASLFGKERTGSRISDAVMKGLRAAVTNKTILEADVGFWCTDAQKVDCPVRDRSALSTVSRRADFLPPSEIAMAARLVAKDNGAVSRDDMARGIARLFGFSQVGADLRAKVDQVIIKMLSLRQLTEDGSGRLSDT